MISFITSIISIVVMSFVAVSYLNLTRGAIVPPWIRSVSFIVGLILLVIALRSAYWDVAQVLLNDNWPAVRDALGGQNASSVFNIIITALSIALYRANRMLK